MFSLRMHDGVCWSLCVRMLRLLSYMHYGAIWMNVTMLLRSMHYISYNNCFSHNSSHCVKCSNAMSKPFQCLLLLLLSTYHCIVNCWKKTVFCFLHHCHFSGIQSCCCCRSGIHGIPVPFCPVSNIFQCHSALLIDAHSCSPHHFLLKLAHHQLHESTTHITPSAPTTVPLFTPLLVPSQVRRTTIAQFALKGKNDVENHRPACPAVRLVMPFQKAHVSLSISDSRCVYEEVLIYQEVSWLGILPV